MPRKPAELTVQRADILLAAAAVFQERGYQGATMADIAAKVNLTAGSLYHHFPAGKRDLLLAVLNTGIETVLAEVQAILNEKASASDRLRRMIASHVVNVTNNVSFGAAMVFEIRALFDLEDAVEDRDRFLRRRAEFEHCFRQVIEEGIASGEFRRVDLSVFVKALLGAHNWISVWYHPQGRLSGAQIADRMADLFLKSLLFGE
ncbi:MAG: TetR family transcriptional regulator [Anaerolineae bacterium]|nr:TetR family transcriptional regulator [Anaerolineae bacterium]